MRPSFFLLPAALVVMLAVACQPGDAPSSVVAEPGADTPAAQAAMDNGVAASQAFRATGNEPGWMVRVAGDAPHALRVEVDYGQTVYDVAAPTQGPDGWAGTATDGTPVKLSIERVACQDDMSGQEFEARAMLTVGTRQLHGCGGFVPAQ